MRPPKEFEDRPFHWISTPEHPQGEPMHWTKGNEGLWWRLGDDEDRWTDMLPEGWVWLGVAEPPSYGWWDRGA